jgi:hypothetical protein
LVRDKHSSLLLRSFSNIVFMTIIIMPFSIPTVSITHRQTLDLALGLAKDKHSSLVFWSISDSFYTTLIITPFIIATYSITHPQTLD